MEAAFGQGVLFVLGLAVGAAGFIGVVFVANSLLSPRAATDEKVLPFECGMEPMGNAWNAVNLRFSTIAMLFVLFDAEAVLLFAVASKLHGTVAGVLEVAAFTAFLALGLAIAWRKGALAWRP